MVGLKLNYVEEVPEQRTLSRFRAIMDSATHPLRAAFNQQSSSFSDRLCSLTAPQADLQKHLFLEQSVCTILWEGGEEEGGTEIEIEIEMERLKPPSVSFWGIFFY